MPKAQKIEPEQWGGKLGTLWPFRSPPWTPFPPRPMTGLGFHPLGLWRPFDPQPRNPLRQPNQSVFRQSFPPWHRALRWPPWAFERWARDPRAQNFVKNLPTVAAQPTCPLRPPPPPPKSRRPRFFWGKKTLVCDPNVFFFFRPGCLSIRNPGKRQSPPPRRPSPPPKTPNPRIVVKSHCSSVTFAYWPQWCVLLVRPISLCIKSTNQKIRAAPPPIQWSKNSSLRGGAPVPPPPPLFLRKNRTARVEG